MLRLSKCSLSKHISLFLVTNIFLYSTLDSSTGIKALAEEPFFEAIESLESTDASNEKLCSLSYNVSARNHTHCFFAPFEYNDGRNITRHNSDPECRKELEELKAKCKPCDEEKNEVTCYWSQWDGEKYKTESATSGTCSKKDCVADTKLDTLKCEPVQAGENQKYVLMGLCCPPEIICS